MKHLTLGMSRHCNTNAWIIAGTHGFPVFHDWSKKKNQPGWPDLFIFTENRVVLVELKAADGKLRKEQRDLKQNLSWLGHTVYVVRSYAGFIRVMEGTDE